MLVLSQSALKSLMASLELTLSKVQKMYWIWIRSIDFRFLLKYFYSTLTANQLARSCFASHTSRCFLFPFSILFGLPPHFILLFVHRSGLFLLRFSYSSERRIFSFLFFFKSFHFFFFSFLFHVLLSPFLIPLQVFLGKPEANCVVADILLSYQLCLKQHDLNLRQLANCLINSTNCCLSKAHSKNISGQWFIHAKSIYENMLQVKDNLDNLVSLNVLSMIK